MMTPKESDRLLGLNQQLRKLYVQKARAQSQHDQARVAQLQAEIDELTEDCHKVLDAADAE